MKPSQYRKVMKSVAGRLLQKASDHLVEARSNHFQAAIYLARAKNALGKKKGVMGEFYKRHNIGERYGEKLIVLGERFGHLEPDHVVGFKTSQLVRLAALGKAGENLIGVRSVFQLNCRQLEAVQAGLKEEQQELPWHELKFVIRDILNEAGLAPRFEEKEEEEGEKKPVAASKPSAMAQKREGDDGRAVRIEKLEKRIMDWIKAAPDFPGELGEILRDTEDEHLTFSQVAERYPDLKRIRTVLKEVLVMVKGHLKATKNLGHPEEERLVPRYHDNIKA